MAQETFYSPTDEVTPAAETARKKPGPKPKTPAPEVQSHLQTMRVESDVPGLTADAGLRTPADEREVLVQDIARIRAQRKPFGAFTQKLAYPSRPGYHRHWFSDEPGRVDEATENGWAHVNGKDSKPLKRVVGRGRDGGPMYGFLMELPEIFWKEDMQAKHDAAQARVDEIKKNPIRSKPGQAQASDAGKFYSPKEEALSMTESLVRSRPST